MLWKALTGLLQITVQVEVDHRRVIVDLFRKWPGSPNDNSVWKDVWLNLFLANSGYPIQAYVLTGTKPAD